MSSLFPIRDTVSLGEDRQPRLIDLDEEVADEVFQALSAETTRRIFAALHESPQTASDLADLTDTSVQNVQYHVGKLQDADLVEGVDTWYSERGTEMTVYAPTDESLVLFAGRDKEGTLRTLLRRVVGVFALLGPASAVVAWLATRVVEEPAVRVRERSSGDESSGPSIQGEGGSSTADTAVELIQGTDPAIVAGVAFFLGGLFVLLVVAGLRYRRTPSTA